MGMEETDSEEILRDYCERQEMPTLEVQFLCHEKMIILSTEIKKRGGEAVLGGDERGLGAQAWPGGGVNYSHRVSAQEEKVQSVQVQEFYDRI